MLFQLFCSHQGQYEISQKLQSFALWTTCSLKNHTDIEEYASSCAAKLLPLFSQWLRTVVIELVFNKTGDVFNILHSFQSILLISENNLISDTVESGITTTRIKIPVQTMTQRREQRLQGQTFTGIESYSHWVWVFFFRHLHIGTSIISSFYYIYSFHMTVLLYEFITMKELLQRAMNFFEKLFAHSFTLPLTQL